MNRLRVRVRIKVMASRKNTVKSLADTGVATVQEVRVSVRVGEVQG